MIIYKITNLINGKIYIGQTIGTLKERQAKYKTENDVRPIIHAIRKYGIDSFYFEIIDTAQNIDELNDKEAFWIKQLDSRNKEIGYNIRPGGFNSPLAEETKQKLSEDRMGANNPFYGKTHSEEFKRKMSTLMSSEDGSNVGRKLSEASKKLISESRKKYAGENHPNFGKKVSNETKTKIRNTLSKLSVEQKQEVIQLITEGLSQNMVAAHFGVSRGVISRIIKLMKIVLDKDGKVAK